MGLITQSAREYFEGSQLFTGDGSTTTFTLTFTPLPTNITPLGIELDPETGVDLSNTENKKS